MLSTSWLGVLLVAAAAAAVLPSAAAAAAAPYDEKLARQLLMLAAATYANETETQETCLERYAGNSDWKIHNEPINEVCHSPNTCLATIFHSASEKKAVIAFRGSVDFYQLLKQLRSSLEPWVIDPDLGKIGQYYATAFNAMWPRLESYLKDENFKDYHITFTGHSLGGALAALAAVKTARKSLRQSDHIRLYTFGEPRIGHHSFSYIFDIYVRESYRLVNGNDAVPHFPACRSNGGFEDCHFGGYWHHGTEIWFPDSKPDKHMVCTGIPTNEDAKCSNSLGWSEFFSWNAKYNDHRTYLGHLVSSYGSSGCQDSYKILYKDDPKFVHPFLQRMDKMRYPNGIYTYTKRH